MSAYFIFTAENALAYAQRFITPHRPALLTAEEVGDGNLNLVFKIKDANATSQLIIKQALPYARCVGEAWPLTLDRARIEAHALIEHGKSSPEHTVKVLHYDPQLAVIVLEDLSHLKIWRQALIAGEHYPKASAQLGQHLAYSLFFNSDFAQPAQQKKAQVQRFINPELCQITEDLFFSDPYQEHQRNQFSPALTPLVKQIRQDAQLQLAVAQLKHQFLSQAQALLHGDMHTGSVFTDEQQLKVIDAEFAFYGPIAFDVGSALGNLLLNYCALTGLFDKAQAQVLRQHRLDDLQALWQQFAQHFIQLSDTHGQDTVLNNPAYSTYFIQQVWHDALGYAGTELIRRCIGLAHVADLESIRNPQQKVLCEQQALYLGYKLILHAKQIDTPQELIEFILIYADYPSSAPLAQIA